VRYLQEYRELGTAGGLLHFRDQIKAGEPNAFFLLHSNLCCDFPLEGMLDFHSRIGDGSHSTLFSVKARQDKANQYGLVAFDEETMQVLQFNRAPARASSATTSTRACTSCPAASSMC